MRLKVFALHPKISPELCRYADLTMWLSLNRLSRYIRRAVVRLHPEGDHVVCSVDLWLGRFGTLAIERSHRDPRVAVQLAAVASSAAIRRCIRIRLGARHHEEVSESPVASRLRDWWDPNDRLGGVARN